MKYGNLSLSTNIGTNKKSFLDSVSLQMAAPIPQYKVPE
jgi:hypothetical protein